MTVTSLNQFRWHDGKSSKGEPAPPAHLRVLIVEDHEDTRFLLKYRLGMHGYVVIEAGNGEDAVRLAESERPDLILMDLSLPLLDGIGAARRIRSLAAPKRMPIVFLSGYDAPSVRTEALAAGGDGFLLKPFEINQFDRMLEKTLAPPRGGSSC